MYLAIVFVNGEDASQATIILSRIATFSKIVIGVCQSRIRDSDSLYSTLLVDNRGIRFTFSFPKV